MPSQIPQALEPDQLDVIVGKGHVDPPLEGRSWDQTGWKQLLDLQHVLDMVKQTGGKQEKFSRLGNPVLKSSDPKTPKKTFQPIHLP